MMSQEKRVAPRSICHNLIRVIVTDFVMICAGFLTEEEEEEEEELMVPQKVETGDSVKMKQVMDDAVIKAVSDGVLCYRTMRSVP